MDQRQLETFLRVAALGNFTRAAEELALSQPAVTRQVMALEKQVGTRLLDRLGHKVALTPAGEVLQRYAVEILRLTSHAEEELARYAGGELGRLRVGCSTTAAAYFLPARLALFRKEFPLVELELKTGGSAEVSRWVESNDVDLGIVMDEPDGLDLTVLPVRHYENVVVLGGQEPRGGKSVGVQEIMAWPWLVTPPGTRLYRQLEKMASDFDSRTNIVMTLDNLETIKRMVRAGMGIALLPRLSVEEELENGSLERVRVVKYRAEKQVIAAVHRKDKYVTAVMKGFIAAIRE